MKKSEQAAAVDEFIIEDLDRACLEQALTMAEVVAQFHRDNKTVRDAIASGSLVARQARFGSVWLITKRSCIERWGENGERRGKRHSKTE